MSDRLPFLLPWLRVNLLIRSITERVWDDSTWPIAKAHLGRALEIRGDLSQARGGIRVVLIEFNYRNHRGLLD